MPQSTWGYLSDQVHEFLLDIRRDVYEVWSDAAQSMPTDTNLKYQMMDKLAAIKAKLNAVFVSGEE